MENIETDENHPSSRTDEKKMVESQVFGKIEVDETVETDDVLWANRKPEKDPRDHAALQKNTSGKESLSLDDVQRRAKWRPNLDFKCLPKGQKYMVVSCFAPKEKNESIDQAVNTIIPCERLGLQIWGVFPDIKEAEQHVLKVREENPHAIFLPIHIVDIRRGRIELPPPRNGSTKQHYHNQYISDIMAPIFENAVKKTQSVHNRSRETLTEVDLHKVRSRTLDETMEKLRQQIVNMSHEEQEKRIELIKKELLQNIPTYDQKDAFDASIVRAHRGKSVLENIEQAQKNISKVAWFHVAEYLKYLHDLDTIQNEDNGKEFRVVYKLFTLTEDMVPPTSPLRTKKDFFLPRYFIVRCMQKFEQNS